MPPMDIPIYLRVDSDKPFGEDNVLTNKSSDLLFKKKQLEKLQEEVVDIADMGSGVSITDLGLNDFRMDLVNYIKENGSLETVANGMHTVCKKDLERGIDEGVVLVLKNIAYGITLKTDTNVENYYFCDWNTDIVFDFTGIDLEKVYQKLVKAFVRDEAQHKGSFGEVIDLDKKIKVLETEISTLESRISKEKQFNRKVEINKVLLEKKEVLKRIKE